MLKIFKKMILLVLLLASVSGAFSTYKADAAENRLSSGYIYFGKPASYLAMAENAGSSLNQISPSYFDLNADGSLKLNASVDTNLISEMHAKGIRVVPFLSNHWNRQTGILALQGREALSAQLADAIAKYKLDGVDVDIENVTEAQRDIYVDLLRLLRSKLPAGKTISAAVAPNPYGIDTGWQGSYDYTAMAAYCDHLTVMAYDEHYEGSEAGPVASAAYVEASIKYALKKVAADKIVLGIPFYGRIWKQGSSYGGYGISAWIAEEFAAKYRGIVTFDTASRSPKAVIEIRDSDEKPTVLGKTLDAGKYTIWYENEQSIKYKLELVQKYDLKGAASWSLGQEAEGTWNYYRLWLDGRYFTDITGHWAQAAILTAESQGWMVGASSTRFLPDAAMTRAQAAAILVRLLGLSTDVQKPTFSDTGKHWAWKEIEAARQAGVVQGLGDGTFGPDLKITREQMAVMLDRILNSLETPENAQNPFLDVNRTDSPWAYDSIMRMAYYGVFAGYSSDRYGPRSTLTRAQMAVLAGRISGILQQQNKPGADA